MRFANGQPAGTGIAKTLILGGGGLVAGFDISLDGVTKCIRTDVYNGWIKSGTDTRWRPAMDASTLPASEVPGGTGYVSPPAGFGSSGAYECVVAPSDHNRIYCCWNARTYISFDAGHSFVRLSNIPDTKMETNSGPQPHNAGKNMAIDPQNPDVFLLGTQYNGFYWSTNQGATVTNFSLGTNLLSGTYGYPSKVACDPTSPVVGNIHQTWYAVVQGTGVFQSTTGPGGTYTLLTGGPTGWITDLKVDQTGTVWCTCPNNTPYVFIYRSGAWQTVTSPGAQMVSTDVNPNNSNHVIVAGENGEWAMSLNAGSTWSLYRGSSSMGTWAQTIPYLQRGPGGTGFYCHVRFDPVVPNKFWVSHGTGVYWCFAPTATAGAFWQLYEEIEGQEELVAVSTCSPPGLAPYFGGWDLSIWQSGNPDVSPRSGYQIPSSSGALEICFDVDYAPSNPSYAVAVVNQSGDHTGYTADGGKTWQAFPSRPPILEGGCIATANSTSTVLLGSNNVPPCYTVDGGNTWTQFGLGGMSIKGSVTIGSGNSAITFKTVQNYNYSPATELNAYRISILAPSGSGSVTYTSTNPSSGASPSITITPSTTDSTASTVAALVNNSSITNTHIVATAGGSGTGNVPVASGTIGFVSGFGYAYYFYRKVAVYDGDMGCYFIYNYGPTGTVGDPIAGIWKSTDGVNWTQAFQGHIAVNLDFHNVKMKKVPGQAGHLFWTSGFETNSTTHMFRSIDGGVTWTQLPNITNVQDIAVGATAPGKSYPSIYFWGYLNNILGMYRSDDNCNSWTQISDRHIGGSLDGVQVIGADANKYGRCYAGFGGSGWKYIDYTYPMTLSA